MRSIQKATLLTLLSTAASLSSCRRTTMTASLNQENSRMDERRIPSASDYGSSVQRKRRRRSNGAVERPPAVDSTLLRFLDQERRLLRERQKRDDLLGFYKDSVPDTGEPIQYNESLKQNRSNDTKSAPPSKQSRVPAPQKASASSEVPLMTENDPKGSINGASPNTSNIVLDTGESWLGQYNQHRVASLLLSKSAEVEKGLSKKLALEAGLQVQNQVLARKVRRRVRAFLQARDKALLSESPQSFSESNEQSTPVQYTFTDVVDVMQGYGLTAKDVAEILVHSPGVALMRPRPLEMTKTLGEAETQRGESLQVTLGRAFHTLKNTLGLRQYDARKILRNTPGLLTMRGSKAAANNLLIMNRLGVSTASLTRDKRGLPALLSRSPEAIFRLVSFLASDAVRMPADKIGPLLRRPISSELLDRVAPAMSTAVFPQMQSAEEFRKDPKAALSRLTGGGVAGNEKRVEIENVYRTMYDTAWTLRFQIGTADLSKVIAAHPSVLLLDAETRILPAAKYLMHNLGIEGDLPKVLQLYPALLSIPLEKIQITVDYLLSLSVDPERLPLVFRSFPAILTMDPEDMQPVVDFLQSIGIANVGRFICRLPPVLGYNVETELRPKWAFIQNRVRDPRFEVTKFPAYFSYPLQRVIRARFAYLEQVKRLPKSLVSLDEVVRFGDNDFCTEVARDPDQKQFKSFCEQWNTANKRRRKPVKQASTDTASNSQS